MIARFIIRAIVLYAVLMVGWGYLLQPYIGVVTALSNRELHVLGIETITKLGPSLDPNSGVAVYHRDAADMQDSLFDFKLESLRSHIPMLLALVFAMPLPFHRRLKSAGVALLMMCLIDSLACIVVMTWSYTFLPEHHQWTPFSNSQLRDSVISFLYDFYNAIGVGFVPLIVWILVSVRKRDLETLVGNGKTVGGEPGA